MEGSLGSLHAKDNKPNTHQLQLYGVWCTHLQILTLFLIRSRDRRRDRSRDRSRRDRSRERRRYVGDLTKNCKVLKYLWLLQRWQEKTRWLQVSVTAAFQEENVGVFRPGLTFGRRGQAPQTGRGRHSSGRWPARRRLRRSPRRNVLMTFHRKKNNLLW